MALAAITAIAVYLDGPWNAASAQSTPANNAGASQAPAMPSGVSEVMKLFKGGIPADIIVSYINNSPLSFCLSADNLISLQKEGVPAPVLTAMIQRNGDLRRQAGVAASPPAQVLAQDPAPRYASQAAQVPAQATVAQYYSAPLPPAASYPYVVASSYPVYDPYYYDPYYYPWYPFGGPVVFGFGFGGGHWGGGGHFGGGGVAKNRGEQRQRLALSDAQSSSSGAER